MYVSSELKVHGAVSWEVAWVLLELFRDVDKSVDQPESLLIASYILLVD